MPEQDATAEVSQAWPMPAKPFPPALRGREAMQSLEAPQMGPLAAWKARREMHGYQMGLLRMRNTAKTALTAQGYLTATTVDFVGNVADANRSFEAIYAANQDSFLATGQLEAVIPVAQQVQVTHGVRIMEAASERFLHEVTRRG